MTWCRCSLVETSFLREFQQLKAPFGWAYREDAVAWHVDEMTGKGEAG